MAFFGSNGTEAGIGIAQHHKGIGLHCLEHRLDGHENQTRRFGSVFTGSIQKVIGFTQTEIFEKHLVEFVVVVLTRMHQHMIDGLTGIQFLNNAGKAYYLGAGAHYGHYFQFLHFKIYLTIKTKLRIVYIKGSFSIQAAYYYFFGRP